MSEHPDHIEIELTTHDARREPRRRITDESRAVAPEESPEGELPVGSIESVRWWSTDRGRLVVTAAGVGIVALLVGWAFGRSTSGDGGTVQDASRIDTETTVEPSPTLPAAPLTGDTLAPVDLDDVSEEAPRPTVPAPATTEAPDAGRVEQVEVHPRLAGLPIRLVGVEAGRLVELDLATGTLTELGRSRASADGAIIVGDDWVIGPSAGANRSLVVYADGSEAMANLGDTWRPLHVPGSDLFWRTSDFQFANEPTVVEQVDLAGEPTGEVIELPAGSWLYGVDPRGGLIVIAAGRSYSVDVDGVTHLGVGELFAVSPTATVLRDCDEQLVCGLSRVDRSSGESVLITDQETEPYLWQPLAGWGGTPGSSALSPDGRYVGLVGVSSSSTRLALLDTEHGGLIELADDPYPMVLAWSVDGRFAFYLDDAELRVYDRQASFWYPALTESRRWTTFGIRPVSTLAEEAVEG